MEVTTPELGPARFWSPKSSCFSGSDSIVIEEAAKNFLSSRPGVNIVSTKTNVLKDSKKTRNQSQSVK